MHRHLAVSLVVSIASLFFASPDAWAKKSSPFPLSTFNIDRRNGKLCLRNAPVIQQSKGSWFLYFTVSLKGRKKLRLYTIRSVHSTFEDTQEMLEFLQKKMFHVERFVVSKKSFKCPVHSVRTTKSNYRIRKLEYRKLRLLQYR